MKVIAVSLRPAAEGPGGAAAVVTVQRGLWGSTPRAHGANASVLAPIYHSKGGWPEGGSGHVRYALDQSRLWVAQYNAAAVGTTACKRSLSRRAASLTPMPRCAPVLKSRAAGRAMARLHGRARLPIPRRLWRERSRADVQCQRRSAIRNVGVRGRSTHDGRAHSRGDSSPRGERSLREQRRSGSTTN